MITPPEPEAPQPPAAGLSPSNAAWLPMRQRLSRQRLLIVVLWTLWFWIWGPPTPLPVGWIRTAAYLAVLALIWSVFAVRMDYGLAVRQGIIHEPFGPWLANRLKALGFEAAFLAVAVGPLPWAMGRWPQQWWLPMTLWLTAAWLIWTWMLPALVLPRLMRTTPLPENALKDRVHQLIRHFAVPAEVVVWHVGARSTGMQAAIAGLGRNRRILVTDTLLNACQPDEVLGILAHELAHLESHDLLRRGLALVIGMGGVLATAALLVTGTVLDSLGLVVAVVLASGGYFRYIRQLEYRADARAVKATGNVWAYGQAMQKIAGANQDGVLPAADNLWQTHPGLSQRLQKLGLDG